MYIRQYERSDYDWHWYDTVMLLFFITIFIVAVWRCDTQPAKPVHVPSAQEVGEKVGEKSTKFGKGFLKGSWDVIQGNK